MKNLFKTFLFALAIVAGVGAEVAYGEGVINKE